MKYFISHYVKSVDDYFTSMGFDYSNNLDEADFLILPGGIDVDPYYYGEADTSDNAYAVDRMNFSDVSKAVNQKKKIIGICRGLQVINLAAGGKMVTDVENHDQQRNTHFVQLVDGTTALTNSRHHQMVAPFNLPRDEYAILGWTEGLSYKKGKPYHKIPFDFEMPSIKRHFCMPLISSMEGDNENIIGVPKPLKNSMFDKDMALEPEIVMYHKLSAIGFQYHPEDMWDSNLYSKGNDVTKALIHAFLDDRL